MGKVGNNTYWNSNGRYQAAIKALEARIPAEGSVDKPRQNRALELFRKASNCYYDLYNNGLCNRAREFRAVFGIASGRYGSYREDYSDRLFDLTESAMDEIIVKAAIEQGLGLLIVDTL